ncbi:hypothetical protein Tco_0414359, partial [Tanacetum coccineum]
KIAICRFPEPVNFSYARNVIHRDIDKVLAMLPLSCSASKLEAVVVLELFCSCGDVSMRVDVCWVPPGLDGPSP